MPKTPAKYILRTLRRLRLDSLEERGSDAELLGKFVDQRDEAAFEELLARHGGMVLSVCRRHLGPGPDAEDAFQAVFLALARDASRIGRRESLAGWLYRVSTFVSRKLVIQNLRRKVGILPADIPDPRSPDQHFGELCSIVGEEVRALPDRLRSAVVLCYLEGRNTAEVAGLLGCPRGTVESRLAAARRRLRVRLVRRGLAPASAVGFEVLIGGNGTTAPPTLIARTLDAISQYTRLGSFAGVVTDQTFSLVAGVSTTMTTRRLPITLAVVSLVAMLVAAGTVLGLRSGPANEAPAAKPAPPADGTRSPEGAVLIGSGLFWHSGRDSRVYFTDGGNALLVVSARGSIRWWDVETGKKLHEITLNGEHDDAVFAPDADILAVVGTQQPADEHRDREPVLWVIDAATRKLIRTVVLKNRLGGNRHIVRISADGKRIFADYEGDIQIIDGKTGDELIRHKGHVNAGALAVSRDGKLVAFGRNDIFLWQWETGEEPRKFVSLPRAGTELMKFSPDGKTLFIATSGDLVTTWDVATGRQTGLRPLRMLSQNLSFSPDGKTIAVASSTRVLNPPEGGHVIDLLDAATWNEVGRLRLSREGVEHVTWSKDGSRLAGVSGDRAWAWDVKSGKVLGPTKPGHEAQISAMAFGPAGTLFTASHDGTIRSWDAVTGTPGLVLIQDFWVPGLAVSPDGTLIAGSALLNDLRVWDAKTGKERFRLLGNGMMGGKRCVRFTPDGKRLIAWGDDEFVRVWDVRNGKLLSEHSTRPPGSETNPDDPFAENMRFINALGEASEISSDGTALALSARNSLRILDPMSGKELQTLNVGDNSPSAFAFAPDGKRVAIASRGKPIQTKLSDGRIRHSEAKDYPVTAWDLASGKLLWTATAEGSWPQVAYSPDGSRIAVVSNVWQGPSRIWVWEAVTGKEVGRIELPSHGQRLAFDQTGKRLAVSFDDTTALVYDLETALKPAK